MIRLPVALAVAVLALAGCSSPPGPDPATPAPRLPAAAVAYDDLLSTDHPFPFTNDCSQFDRAALQRIGAAEANVLTGLGGPAGCSLALPGDTFAELWIESLPPPNPSEPRYFPLAWNGRLGGSTYHRRLLLDQRYYAVETIDFKGGNPGCYLAIDPGSPTALQFRGVLPDAYAASYGELNHAFTDYEVDRDGIDRFMAENCPRVEELAVAALASIDPGGGSLRAG